jgi:hypothetical protein
MIFRSKKDLPVPAEPVKNTFLPFLHAKIESVEEKNYFRKKRLPWNFLCLYVLIFNLKFFKGKWIC